MQHWKSEQRKEKTVTKTDYLFKAGDKVKENLMGKTGIITRVSEGRKLFRVEFPDGSFFNFTECELELSDH